MKFLKNSDKLRKIVFVLSTIVFVTSLAIIINLCFIEPHKNSETMREIEDVYYGDEEAETDRGNLEDLLAINSDIKGWIKILLSSSLLLLPSPKILKSRGGKGRVNSEEGISKNPER